MLFVIHVLATLLSLGLKLMDCTIEMTHFRNKRQDLFNAMGSVYASVLFMGCTYASSVQPVVAIERTVFYRERAAGMYSALPYAVGQVFTLRSTS